MSLISLVHRQAGFRVQLHAIQTTKIRSIVHPVLTRFRIYYNARVYCIHVVTGFGFYHTSFLCPGTFGRVGFGKTNVGCLPSKCRNTVIQSVFIVVPKYIRRPNVGCTSAAAVVQHPVFGFSRYFGECPAGKLPVNQIFRFAYLYIAEGQITFLNFFLILPKNGIGGIHVIRISEKFTGWVVNVVCSPFSVIFHGGNVAVVVLPGIGAGHRFKGLAAARSKQEETTDGHH